MTLGNWGSHRLPGKAILFEKLAKLKKKNGQIDPNNNSSSSSVVVGNKPLFSGPQISMSQCDDINRDDTLIMVCDFCTNDDDDAGDAESAKEPEWLNIIVIQYGAVAATTTTTTAPSTRSNAT